MMPTQTEVRAGLGKSIELLGVLNEQLSLPEQFPQFAELSEEDCQRLVTWLDEFNGRLFVLVTTIQADLLRVAAEQRRQFPPPSSAN